nr:DUF2092 domain-containing protein [Sinorhizobium fredii]
MGYYFFHWIGSVEVWNDACPGCIAHWQLWVERGPAPIPRKYVITSKTMAAAPQYTLRIKSWDTDTPPDAKSFAFAPPQGAKSVEFNALADVGEVPAPAEALKE